MSLALAKYSDKGNARAFHVPERGRLPTPETSPQTETLFRMTTIRTGTPDSLSGRENGAFGIGMALGSPSQAPPHMPMPWKASKVLTSGFEIPEPVEEPQTKQKPKKWGIFGRSKSKRGRSENHPQRSMTDTSHSHDSSISSGAGSLASTRKGGKQMDQDTNRAPKHKPIVIRSQTEPGIVPQWEAKEASRELGHKTSNTSIRAEASRNRIIDPAAFDDIPPVPPLSNQFLNIEIPSITMERYSIMFGTVLQPPPASHGTLLERRQATLDRLRTINDEIARDGGEELPRPRRATSPHPKNSPVFSLFPTTPGGAKPPHLAPKPSPRARSNTSPAMLHSPSQATFDAATVGRKELLRAKVVQVSGGKRPQREVKEVSPERRPAQLQLVSKFNKRPSKQQLSPFTPEMSSLILESPESTDDESSSIHIKESLKPAVPEPSWQMVSPPPPPSTSPQRPPVPKTAPPPPPAPPQPPLTFSPEILSVEKLAKVDPEEAHRSAVEMSIARQISVSHQQRKMLNQQNARRRNDSNPAPGPGAAVLVQGPGIGLSETKTATPRLVSPAQMLGSPDALLINRKSELVVLEGV